MKKKGKFSPKVLTFLYNKESLKITDRNMQYMRAVWRRWNMECCIADPWSSLSEEEMFESAGKKWGLTPLPCKGTGHSQNVSHEHRSGLTHQVVCQCGRAVLALSTFT